MRFQWLVKSFSVSVQCTANAVEVRLHCWSAEWAAAMIGLIVITNDPPPPPCTHTSCVTWAFNLKIWFDFTNWHYQSNSSNFLHVFLVLHVSSVVCNTHCVSIPSICVCTSPDCMRRVSSPRQGKPLELTLSIFRPQTQFQFLAKKWPLSPILSLFDDAFLSKQIFLLHNIFLHISLSCAKTHIWMRPVSHSELSFTF